MDHRDACPDLTGPLPQAVAAQRALPGLDRRTLLRRAAYLGALAGAGPLATQVFAGTQGTPVVADGLAFARVRPRTLAQARALQAFDETHRRFGDGSLELLLWPGDRARLDALGIDYQVFAPSTVGPARGRTSGLPLQPGERVDGYRRLGDYYADMQQLATDHPKNARLIKLPEPSLEGRDMFALEIADDVVKAATDGRPTFVVDGVHHAREWPSSEYTIMFAFDLLQNRTKDAKVAALLKKLRIVVIPIVNPDGFTHSREGLAMERTEPELVLAVAGLDTYWRKNKRSLTGLFYAAGGVTSYGNADAHGTDPNRNYPFYWGGEGGGADPTSQTYGGAAPYAEPESRNISGYLKGAQTTAYLTNHTSGQLCMRPWGYTADDSPDGPFQEELGERMCAFHDYNNQIGLSLYPTAGTSRDWSYGALRTIVYTFEHNQEFHPDYASEIPQTYALNRPAWLVLAEAAADPRNHGVIKGKVTGVSDATKVTITLTKSFKTPTAVEVDAKEDGGVAETIKTVATARKDGTFTVHANPSTRPTTIQDGRPKELWTVQVTAPGKKTITKKVFLDRGTKVDLGTLRL